MTGGFFIWHYLAQGGISIPWYFYAIVFGSIGCVILICLLPKKYLQQITDRLKKEQKIQEEAELERAKHSFEEQEKERRNNPVADGIKDGTICENCEWRPAATEGEAAGYGMCQKCWDADSDDVDTTSRDQVDSDEERTCVMTPTRAQRPLHRHGCRLLRCPLCCRFFDHTVVVRALLCVCGCSCINSDLEKRLDADAEDMEEAERRKEELKKQGYTSYEQFDKRIK
jgi:hypothetical protein|eukprot:COSAG01_NODE_2997_length_6741_cov_8.936917_7_plen_227_part_00